MSYVYRCRACRASAPSSATRQAAEQLRDEHRASHHGGLVPAGDEVVHETAPVSSARYMSGRKVLVGIGVLIVAETAARIYSRLH
ncbi:hypothetical protein OHU11_29945 [Streptomyces sp. NBC_00257]|uniref:hypothetical protein n=1 Tax=unclassified Streptomyces TaxID=2593676 RepID=UPI002258FC0E|nr:MULTISPECIES: hypothetical protein [unclassified Streptomyces]MCX5431874.1 hypothetical protein [Streptomyces sp. NBC_00062]